jgi:SSS family solute:Na+ symporter
MSVFDWAIVIVPWFVILAIGHYTQRYVKDIADFLSAGRSAGRYLVCMAEGMAGIGLITVVGAWELVYNAGFTLNWWGNLALPVTLIMTLTGFVIYRYRETRAMTMAQFFEIRYSRRFRVFMGMMAWISGILNYGIFPAVSARFFVYYCGMPETLHWGGVAIPTFGVLMAIFLALALYFVLLGGQLQVMVTDCVQGIICGVLFLVVIIAVLRLFTFDQIYDGLASGKTGESLLNPFDTSRMKDFNIWYVLIGVFGSVYNFMSWQGSQGFNSSALNPHEAKMGKILAGWRAFAQTLAITLLAVAAITYLRHPAFAEGAARVTTNLGKISNPQLREQMTVSVALADFLPVGIKGVLAAIMMFLMVTTDTSYLHSWGSIFVQDVILPLRRKPLSTAQHLRYLRWSIAGVAVFAFFFSLLFRQTEYVFMFFAITGALYLGGSGACIIGGLYWKKGTTTAAWLSMLAGSGLAIFGIVIKQVNPAWPINGQIMWFFAMVLALLSYVLVSLLTCRHDFDMDKLLHRGRHTVADDKMREVTEERKLRNWKKLFLGFDEHFTRGDRAISTALFGWSMFWFGVFVVVTLSNILGMPWTNRSWWRYNLIQGILLPLIIGPLTTIWFTFGGLRDLTRLFRRLAIMKRDESDDGTVTHDQPDTPQPK